MLSACFEGIIEVAHPYKFIARQACKELLKAENSHYKIIPIISRLYEYIRIALLDDNDETFKDALDICFLLVFYAGREGFPYTKLILTPLRRRLSNTNFQSKILIGRDKARRCIKFWISPFEGLTAALLYSFHYILYEFVVFLASYTFVGL